MNNRACFGNLGWTFFLVVFLLVGCSTTPPVKYYTLNTLPAMPKENPGASFAEDIAIGVGPVVFPKFLDRPQVVTRKSQNRVEVSEFHRWASSLRGNFSRVLAKNISILLPTNRVAAFPWGDQFSPTYRIKLDVDQFDGQFGKDVLLNVTWSVAEQEGTDELVVRSTLIREPIAGKDYEALVAAQSQALATLGRAIVDEIRKLR